MRRLSELLREPSTYAGLAGLVLAAGQIFQVPEAGLVADTITDAAPDALSGNWPGVLAAVLSSLAIWLRERR